MTEIRLSWCDPISHRITWACKPQPIKTKLDPVFHKFNRSPFYFSRVEWSGTNHNVANVGGIGDETRASIQTRVLPSFTELDLVWWTCADFAGFLHLFWPVNSRIFLVSRPGFTEFYRTHERICKRASGDKKINGGAWRAQRRRKRACVWWA